MTYQVPGCAICNTPRCNLCRLKKSKFSWRNRRQALYSLCEDAALLGLTTVAPGFVQPHDLSGPTTNTTSTVLEPDPTYDQVRSQGGLLSVPMPEYSNPQSLEEHDLQRREDTQVLAARKLGKEGLLSSSPLSQAGTIDITTDPSFVASSITTQVPDRASSRLYQTDTIDIIVDAFKIWKSQDNSAFNCFASTVDAVPPSSSHPNQSTAPERSRKRTPTQGNSSKQGSPKRAKVSSDEASQTRKDEKRLLACPFWKKDPIRHRNCFRGVKRIRDVKQHLRRNHTQPVFCRRCGTEFGNEEAALSEHLRAADLCEIRYFQDPDGVTVLHEKALKRHSDRGANEAAQWYAIWDHLFLSGQSGGLPPPPRPSSPYVDNDLSEDMSSFREFSHREGWRALATDRDLNHVALSVDEDLLQRCLDRIYENWLAKRSTGSQQSWDDSSVTLSDSSTPDETVPTSDTTTFDHQLLDDDIMTLSEFPADLDFGDDFLGPQINETFNDFMAMSSVDNATAQAVPCIPLLTSEHGSEHAVHAESLDPSLISR